MAEEKLTRPEARLRVYDLVREAGLDVSDWANYRRPQSPASNPKYCYDWAFEGTDRVVLCLWYEEMQQEGDTVFQVMNYREMSAARRRWNANQRERARRMDHAIQLANNRRLPIRVIVVDGSRRGDDEERASNVERRFLDPVPWLVASYDDDGNARLQRGAPADLGESVPTDAASGWRRLARIAYNSGGWQRPTGEASQQESGDTYSTKNKFGHEDWLFRAEWVIDGWRYAFIQGLNNSRRAYLGHPLDVTLFTILPDKRRRLVATIYGLEGLNDEQAQKALKVFRERGWLKSMQDDIAAIGGNASALGSPKWAEHVLNVRYRLENVDSYPADTFLPDNEWIKDRHRYLLYTFDETQQALIERSVQGRRGSQDMPEPRRLFRRGTKPIEYTPEHNKMQATLFAELQQEYGKDHVWLEKDFVDARVETEKELIFYEIKTDLEPRAVIRQAIGQILEYAFHPARIGRCPDNLVIVGRTALRPEDEAYLKNLREKFKLPLSYRIVAI